MDDFKAVIIQYECGWGRRVGATHVFETKEACKAFVDKFNSDPENAKPISPNRYVVAREV